MSVTLYFISLVMNQKALQSGSDKSVNGFLNFFPVSTMIADHKLVDGQAAVHLKIEYGFRFFKGKNTVGHQPGDIVFFMVRHLINDPCGDRVIQKEGTEHVVTVDFIAKRIRAVGVLAFLGKDMVHDTGGIGQHII